MTFNPALHPTGSDGRFIDRTRLEAPVTLEYASRRGIAVIPPSGCGVCGEEERGHTISWDPAGQRYHTWEQPTAEQRRERVLAGIERQQAIRDGKADTAA